MQFLIYDKIEDANPKEINRLSRIVCEQRKEYAESFANIYEQWARLKTFECLSFFLPKCFNTKTLWLKTERGKPYVSGCNNFSISHCKIGLAVATHDKPIGIDIENTNRFHKDLSNAQKWIKNYEALIHATMNQKEIEIIMRSDHPHVKFFTLWTQKEAYYKYLGTGVDGGIKNVLTYLNREKESKVELKTICLKDKNYIISLAYER